MSQPLPQLYSSTDTSIVHALRYDWNGWFDSTATDLSTVEQRLPDVITACRPLWLADGLETNTWRLTPDGTLQVLFTVAPHLSPALCAARAKGRLDHALRQSHHRAYPGVDDAIGLVPVEGRLIPADAPQALAPPAPHLRFAFRRNVALRTLGENTREIVDAYLTRQAVKSDYADPRFKTFLDQFNTTQPTVDLAQPAATGHGRYWCNLHLVITVADRRYPMINEGSFAVIRDAAFAIAAANGHQLAHIAVMPDHLHLSLRFAHETAPADVGLHYLNGLAAALHRNQRCWNSEFYVGSFSEYDLDTIRRRG